MARLAVFQARLASLPLILLGVSGLAFWLIHLVPGDPALTMLGLEADDASIETMRHILGVDQPLLVQYGRWIIRLLSGDWGRSVQGGREVSFLLLSALGPTVQLAIAALFISLTIGVPAGVIAATRPNTAADFAVSILALFGLSMPSFWLGLLLILALTVYVPIFPGIGYVAPFVDPVGHLEHLALPALTLGTALAATTMRITRSTMLHLLRSDFVRTAYAKGLSNRRVIWRHALGNAWIPLVTVLGSQISQLLGGAVVAETVFDWPGIGKLSVDAILARDYPVVQGSVLLSAILVIFVNLVVDLIYIAVDPRVRPS